MPSLSAQVCPRFRLRAKSGMLIERNAQGVSRRILNLNLAAYWMIRWKWALRDRYARRCVYCDWAVHSSFDGVAEGYFGIRLLPAQGARFERCCRRRGCRRERKFGSS